MFGPKQWDIFIDAFDSVMKDTLSDLQSLAASRGDAGATSVSGDRDAKVEAR